MEQNKLSQNKPFNKAPPFKSKEAQDIVKILSTVGSNLKILEDRYSNLRKKTQLTDQVLIETQRGFAKDKRLINEELLDIKSRIQKLVESIEDMQKELSETVKMNDFLVLKKYVDYWEPLRFVTRKELQEVLNKR